MLLREQLHLRLRHHEKMWCPDDGVVSSSIGHFVNPPYHRRLVLIGKSISASGLIHCNNSYLHTQIDIHAASQKEGKYEFKLRYCTKK